jgi:hypothetical protein
MVLVSEKPSNGISILQTKFGDRERHEARRVRLEAVPLDEHIESGHGERQGRNEMDPPLCGSTSMSHNDFGVRCNHVATGDESNETRDERPRD